MLPLYSFPLVLRALRSPLYRTLPTVRFSTSAVRAGGQIQEASPETLSPPQAQLPYFVHRSASKNLPIYLETKNGGTLRRTRIRKIEGDARVLRESLIQALRLNPEWVTINGITNHILIKGWVKFNAENFLKKLGF